MTVQKKKKKKLKGFIDQIETKLLERKGER
jgi:hypothetical protein